jgi:hypothetical protein
LEINLFNCIGFHHEHWGDFPPQSQYKLTDLKSWQEYYKGEPLDITEEQKETVKVQLSRLAQRVFIQKKRFGTQWFRLAFMEGYRVDI